MTKSVVPFLTENNINNAFNARLEIIYVDSYNKKIPKYNLIILKKKLLKIFPLVPIGTKVTS